MKEKTNIELHHCYLLIPDTTGDTRIMLSWDPTNPKAVAEMKKKFEELRNDNYLITECKGFLGRYKPKGEPLTTFPENKNKLIAEKIITEKTDIEVQEVILSKVEKETEENELYNSEETPKNGSTYGVTETISGG